MLKGAWPVFGFFGLDVLLVYIFFKINFKSGKKKVQSDEGCLGFPGRKSGRGVWRSHLV